MATSNAHRPNGAASSLPDKRAIKKRFGLFGWPTLPTERRASQQHSQTNNLPVLTHRRKSSQDSQLNVVFKWQDQNTDRLSLTLQSGISTYIGKVGQCWTALQTGFDSITSQLK
ncbi:hypothetical protein MCOR04_011460 [Pyricularia oryzae]|nr:hypothetical protein MCOR04_011460 [Pyricularia oryzae]